MNPIQPTSSPIVTVPSFGHRAPVEGVIRTEAIRVELDPTSADKLTEAVLVARQLEKAGVSLQPQLRGPANNTLPFDTDFESFVVEATTEGVSGAALLQASFDRHFSTAAEDVAAVVQSLEAPETVRRMVSNGFAALFAHFMDAMRESRRNNREISVQQSAAAVKMAENAGASGVEAATNNLIGAIFSTTVTAAVSSGHVAKTAQSSNVLSKSAQQNQLPQPPTAPPAPTATAAPSLRSSATPSTSPAGDGATATAASTPDVPQPASTAANAGTDRIRLTPEQEAGHTIAQAESARLHSQGLLFSTVAGPMGQIAGQGGQVAAAHEEAARLEYQTAADTSRQISSTQSEQASHDEQLLDALFQMLQRMNSEHQGSLSQIIGNI